RLWPDRPFKLASAANYTVNASLKLFVLRGVSDEAALSLAAGKIAAKMSSLIRRSIAALALPILFSPIIFVILQWIDVDEKRGPEFISLVLTTGIVSFLLLYAPALFS